MLGNKEEFRYKTSTNPDDTDEEGWYYLSFVDPDLPEGSSWLGGCFVHARNNRDAAAEAWVQGCNPGGDVLIFGPTNHAPQEQYRNRILNHDEVRSAKAGGLRPIYHQHENP